MYGAYTYHIYTCTVLDWIAHKLSSCNFQISGAGRQAQAPITSHQARFASWPLARKSNDELD